MFARYKITTDSAVVRSNNQFALDVLKTLSTLDDNNIFFSPLSISAAIAMTSLGARGDTLSEIDKVLHFNDVKKTSTNPYALHETLQKTMSLFEENNSKYSLSIANRLFAQKDCKILSQFLEDTNKYYKAALQQVDFGSGEAEEIINQWVASQTNNKIKDLFKPGSLDPSTALALVNAIYFKGTWKKKFSKGNTMDMVFHLISDESKIIKMMGINGLFSYAEDSDLNVQILELPYAENDLSLIVILPKLGKISNLISKLTAKQLDKLLDKLKDKKVIVRFPKFKLETEYSLENTLAQLGINSLFDMSADLSGISNDKLYVSKVIHKAFIETDEKGTEAAAATAIGQLKCRRLISKKVPEFIADHPFLFGIVDKRLFNKILFLGKLTEP